jgi:hypothetical protein
LSLEYVVTKSYFSLLGKLGADFGNCSYFNSLQLEAQRTFELGSSLKLKLIGSVGNIWGTNVMQYDWFFTHMKKWEGSRSQRYAKTRAELFFVQYPYLSLMSWIPFLYGEVWTSFARTQNNSFDAKIKGDYGVGMASNNGRLSLSFSLFGFSKERKAGLYGPIKFSIEE